MIKTILEFTILIVVKKQANQCKIQKSPFQHFKLIIFPHRLDFFNYNVDNLLKTN